MKTVFIVFFLTINVNVFSQEYSFISNEFHAISLLELSGLNKKFLTISALNSEGQNLTSEEINIVNKSPDFQQQFFTDRENLIIVYKRLSESEKKQKLRTPTITLKIPGWPLIHLKVL